MPPKSVPAVEGEDAPAPRRSGRLASVAPAAPLPEKQTKPRAASKTKKRSADDDGAAGGAGGSKGKVKAAKKDEGDDTKGESEELTNTEDIAPGADADPATAKLSPIEVGDVLPSFVLKNEKDEDVDVNALTAEKGLVLFLVPKADTPGCTNQACGFRDIYPDFTSHNFEVYCLSADTPAAQTKWQTKKELPYPLLSDRKRVLIGALGAADGAKTKRSHFIFEKGGKLLDKKLPVKPVDSPKLALEFIKTLGAS